MAVSRIKHYRQQNGVDVLKVFCEPRKNFPAGRNYWYAPAEAADLVEKFAWYLNSASKDCIFVLAQDRSAYIKQPTLSFHREYLKRHKGFDGKSITDHVSCIEYDNLDDNLKIVTRQQCSYNIFTRGYDRYNNSFRTSLSMDTDVFSLSFTSSEDEACIQQSFIEYHYLRDMMKEQYYMFDLFKYRRGSEDILDLERTGEISEEEAVYRHILKYADNAWYYLRFGLQDFFRDYGIPVPQYSLDTDGFMVHSITGQKLCPLYK